jgi:hypothetical protein
MRRLECFLSEAPHDEPKASASKIVRESQAFSHLALMVRMFDITVKKVEGH